MEDGRWEMGEKGEWQLMNASRTRGRERATQDGVAGDAEAEQDGGWHRRPTPTFVLRPERHIKWPVVSLTMSYSAPCWAPLPRQDALDGYFTAAGPSGGLSRPHEHNCPREFPQPLAPNFLNHTTS